jgi:phytoene synthase
LSWRRRWFEDEQPDDSRGIHRASPEGERMPGVSMDSAADAYRHCEALTREQAGNFYYGIRLLPGPKRRAMCAVYAFARLIDDIGDGDEPAERKLELLGEARAQLESDDGRPVRVALDDAARRFALPRAALTDLIDGVEMDVRGTEYETFDELVPYCRRVAGSIGRLCLAIFGSSDMARAAPLADDLGVAMQLTNILRDVREDLDRGRVYLPAEDRRRFGCDDLEAAAPERFARLMAFEVQRARDWFDRGLALVGLIDARSASCVCAMTGIYRRILDRIDQAPQAVLDDRLSLAAWEKTWVALRSLTGAAR